MPFNDVVGLSDIQYPDIDAINGGLGSRDALRPDMSLGNFYRDYELVLSDRVDTEAKEVLKPFISTDKQKINDIDDYLDTMCIDIYEVNSHNKKTCLESNIKCNYEDMSDNLIRLYFRLHGAYLVDGHCAYEVYSAYTEIKKTLIVEKSKLKEDSFTINNGNFEFVFYKRLGCI